MQALHYPKVGPGNVANQEKAEKERKTTSQNMYITLAGKHQPMEYSSLGQLPDSIPDAIPTSGQDGAIEVIFKLRFFDCCLLLLSLL